MPLPPLRAPVLAACLALAPVALTAVGPPAAASARAITQPTPPVTASAFPIEPAGTCLLYTSDAADE